MILPEFVCLSSSHGNSWSSKSELRAERIRSTAQTSCSTWSPRRTSKRLTTAASRRIASAGAEVRSFCLHWLAGRWTGSSLRRRRPCSARSEGFLPEFLSQWLTASGWQTSSSSRSSQADLTTGTSSPWGPGTQRWKRGRRASRSCGGKVKLVASVANETRSV